MLDGRPLPTLGGRCGDVEGPAIASSAMGETNLVREFGRPGLPGLRSREEVALSVGLIKGPPKTSSL